MILAPETIDAYKDCMLHPEKNGLVFKPLTEIFENSDKAIAKHIVYENYLILINKSVKHNYEKNHMPKAIFYIIMDELYEQKKADDGNMGYCVVFKS